MENVKLTDGRTVKKRLYIIAKTNQLIEFGYRNLKKKEVGEQLEKIIKGEELNVIGLLMEDDILN